MKGSPKNPEAEFTDTCPKSRNQKEVCEMFGKFLAAPGQIWQVIKRREKREGHIRGNTRRGEFSPFSLYRRGGVCDGAFDSLSARLC